MKFNLVINIKNKQSISKINTILKNNPINNIAIINSTAVNLDNLDSRFLLINNSSSNIQESINTAFNSLISVDNDFDSFLYMDDDFLPYYNWSYASTMAFNNYPRLGVITPVVYNHKTKSKTSVFNYSNNIENPFKIVGTSIENDVFTPIFSRNFFIITKDTFLKVGDFDTSFETSLWEMDYAIRCDLNNIRIVALAGLTVSTFAANSTKISFDLNDLKNLHDSYGSNLSTFNLIQPKSIVECQIYNQDHLLEAWLKNVSKYADEIVILFSKEPWLHNYSAKNRIKDDKSEEILDKYVKLMPKLKVVKGHWIYETDERNLGLSIAKSRGAKWLLISDCDEFYIESEVFAALDFMRRNPTDIYVMNTVQMVKNKNLAAMPENGHPLCNFCINTDTVKEFLATRVVSGRNILVPYDICKCWHISYLLPKEKLEQKLETSFHFIEFNKNWYSDIWPNININSTNVHPTHPEAWSYMREVNIPEEILNEIEYLK